MAIGVESRPTIQFNLPQPGFTIPIDNFGHVRPKSEKCIPDIPQGWQLDCSRLKDEQIQSLVNAGYIPLLPKQYSKNRGLVLPPERYLLDFGERRIKIEFLNIFVLFRTGIEDGQRKKGCLGVSAIIRQEIMIIWRVYFLKLGDWE